jgi:hypothetical protein
MAEVLQEHLKEASSDAGQWLSYAGKKKAAKLRTFQECY